MRLLLFALVLLVLPGGLRAQTTPVWQTSIVDARHIADRCGRPILILFSGTGWDQASDAFLKDFTHAPGFPLLASHVVLLRIDMPSAPPTLTTDTQIQNNNTAVILRIDTVPTLVLCDSMLTSKYKASVTGLAGADVVTRLTGIIPR